MKKIYYSAIALFALASCSEGLTGEATPGTDNKPSYNMIDVCVDAQVSNTRSIVTGPTTSWEESDQLGLFHSQSINEPFTNTASGFEGQLSELNDGGEIVSAIYPYDANPTLEGGVYTHKIVINQLSDMCDTPFMFGQTEKEWNNDSEISIALKPITSIIEVKMTGIPAGTVLNRFTFKPVFTTAGKKMPNLIHVNTADGSVSYGGEVATFTIFVDEADQNATVTVDNGEYTFRVQVAELDMEASSKWTIIPKASADDAGLFTYIHTFPKATTVPAGSYVPMEIAYPNLTLVGEEWVSTISDDDTAIVVAGSAIGDKAIDTIKEAFETYPALTTLDIRGTSTEKIFNINGTKMQEILLPNSLLPIGFNNGALVGNDLRSIVIPVGVKTVNAAAFANNPNLKYVEFRGAEVELRGSTFVNKVDSKYSQYFTENYTPSDIQLVFSGATAVPTIVKATALNGVSDVYVPAALKGAFEADANWNVATIHSLDELAK